MDGLIWFAGYCVMIIVTFFLFLYLEYLAQLHKKSKGDSHAKIDEDHLGPMFGVAIFWPVTIIGVLIVFGATHLLEKLNSKIRSVK